MNKFRTRIQDYINKSSRWKIAGDVVFYLFIILLLIPATRKPISTTLIKLTMRKPMVETKATGTMISSEDKAILLEDLQGNMHQLGDFEGKVILLNFWATWCPPCRAEMPSIQKLYNDYGNQISILLVSSEERLTIQNYLEENGYTFPVYIQRSALTSSFPVSSIPTTYLINKRGELIMGKRGAANWNADSFRAQLDGLISQ